MPPKGMGLAIPSTKRKPLDKTDRLPKKPKVAAGSGIGENSNANKLTPPFGLGKGKDLITGQGPVIEKRPVLFHEDSWYALKQLFSIIKDDDYKDLGNHATKAMGETGLFSLTQVCISILLSFPSCRLFIFLTFFLILIGGAHDEGFNGLLPVS